MSIATITPVRYHVKDGVLSRDLDRLVDHIRTLKSQTIGSENIDVFIGDGTQDKETVKKIKEICHNNGANYIRLNTKDVFNRGLMINETFLNANIKSEYLALFDMDLVLCDNLFERFLESWKSKDESVNVLLAGINFLSIEKLDGRPVNKELFQFQKESEVRRFISADGLQFMKTDFFVEFGGLDVNFNLYCGTDNEILDRGNFKIPRKTYVLNKNIEDCLAFHLDHDKNHNEWKGKNKKFTLNKEVVSFFCSINRLYLSSYIRKGKFTKQNNLSKKLYYLGIDEEGFFFGNEKEKLITSEEFDDLNDNLRKKILNLYIKNRSA
jgi:hypothetical protein